MTFIIVLLFQLVSFSPLQAQIPSSAPSYEMTVIPRDVFIGDEMEIRYVFTAEHELLSSDSDTYVLTVPESDDVTVLETVLSRENGRYVLTVRCIGWQTGLVTLPEIDLQQCNPMLEEPYSIVIPPVTVQSAVDYTGKTDLRPARAPLVIPGTTWIIYAIIILCVILFIILVVILLKFRAFKDRFLAAFASVITARNYWILKQRMKRFLKRYSDAGTDVFATELAHFIRGYMTTRFKTDFEPVTASEFTSAFMTAMNFICSSEAAGAVDVIAGILLRCDYVRFSGDAGESGSLGVEERNTMCADFMKAVVCFDREASE